jgi:reactive intermediate/imine deaminase
MRRSTIVVTAALTTMGAAALASNARLRHLNPPTLFTPTGYTQVVTPLGGHLVFIAGQVAADTTGAVVGKGDFKAQVKQVFENLQSAVEAAGGTMADIAKINVYVTDTSQLAAMREVWQQYFTAKPPASTLVQVVRLAREEYLIEIEAIAVVE